MAHVSDNAFTIFHALRIKGFAKPDVLADMTGHDQSAVEQELAALAGREHAMFREKQNMWQITPGGREAHKTQLASDVKGADLQKLTKPYGAFLALNEEFKELCGAWQMREGAINDHADAAYDKKVSAQLAKLDGSAQPIVTQMAGVLGRLSPYTPRLAAAHGRFVSGQTNMFTGVMCNSYHDVWMELHEDLILSQGIDRAKEGSF